MAASPETIARMEILGTLRRNLQTPGLVGTQIHVDRDVDLEKLADQLWLVTLRHTGDVLKPVRVAIDEMTTAQAAERGRTAAQLRTLWILAGVLVALDVAQWFVR